MLTYSPSTLGSPLLLTNPRPIPAGPLVRIDDMVRQRHEMSLDWLRLLRSALRVHKLFDTPFTSLGVSKVGSEDYDTSDDAATAIRNRLGPVKGDAVRVIADMGRQSNSQIAKMTGLG